MPGILLSSSTAKTIVKPFALLLTFLMLFTANMSATNASDPSSGAQVVGQDSVELQALSGAGANGCAPYTLEFELVPVTQSFTGAVTHTSGARPDVAFGGQVFDDYPKIAYADLMDGVTYKWRVRERAGCSGNTSNWVNFGLTFLVGDLPLCGSCNESGDVTLSTHSGPVSYTHLRAHETR